MFSMKKLSFHVKFVNITNISQFNVRSVKLIAMFLFLGVKFGMTSKEFYAHCWDLNRKKLITQGPSNNSVRYYLPTESIGQKIEMLFY